MNNIKAPYTFLDPVMELARDAGRRIMKFYQQEVSIEHKEDRTPLTEADMAAHNAIVAGFSVNARDTCVVRRIGSYPV